MSKEDKKVTAANVSQETQKQQKEELYNQYVTQMTPKHNWFLNSCKAFLIGGMICTIGQAFINFYSSRGSEKELASAYTTLTLVFIAVLLTGLTWYQKLAKFAGAGSIVPITGFANSVAAPAIEFKREGQIFGIGCKIFTIAGPVILYGIFSSWILGLIYYIWKQFFS